jgi:excisionase family DNA binding protein
VGVQRRGGDGAVPDRRAAFDEQGPTGKAMTITEAPDVLTVEECAQLARTGPKPIYRAIRKGELYGRRIGRNIRIPKRAFVAWLEGEGSGEVQPLRVLRMDELDPPHGQPE